MGPVLLLLVSAAAFLVAACNGDDSAAPSTRGAIQVTAATTGAQIDADGYTVQAGSQSRALGVNASTVFGDLDPGDYSIALSGVHLSCTVAGDNPRSLTVTAGQTVPTTFAVACGPPPERIAFATDRDGNFEIYAMNPDGTGLTRVTDHPARDVDPDWSPDGSRIVFESDRDQQPEYSDIYMMNADGTGLTRLTDDAAWDGEPAWSPDGSRVAFASVRSGNPDIFVMNADGTGLTNLTNDPAHEFTPAWSPDGSKVAFERRDPGREIYVMNADGTGVTNLTNHAAPDGWPAWSPDGTRIAFASNRAGGGIGNNVEIYVMNTDGSGVTQLTQDPMNLDARDEAPVWSPGGDRIAFVTDRDGNREIYVMNGDGTGFTNLTNHPAFDATPAWLW
ncbi:MAG: TolB family protein [Gemmatimonadales bacterium]